LPDDTVSRDAVALAVAPKRIALAASNNTPAFSCFKFGLGNWWGDWDLLYVHAAEPNLNELEEHYQTADSVEIPAEMVQHELPDGEMLEVLVNARGGYYCSPATGKGRTIEMVERNAQYELTCRS